MKNNLLLFLAATLVIVLGGYFYLNRNSAQKSAKQSLNVKSIVVDLSEYSDSGQIGTATLTEAGSMLKVEIDLSGYEASGPQPAHIHTGLCPRIGPVVFGLSDVVDGKSVSEVETSLEGLLATYDELNVNVHESYDNFKAYTSCGDVI